MKRTLKYFSVDVRSSSRCRGYAFLAHLAAARRGDNVSEEHVELIWTEGQHIRGDRDDELRQLLDIVLSRVAASH